MIVAIDYDDTWTLAPREWNQVVELLMHNGHTVIMVTQRVEPWLDEPREVAALMGVKMFWGSAPKREIAAMNGYNVDVWIDDSPEGILYERFFIGPDVQQ
jgi:hypothetical protein